MGIDGVFRKHGNKNDQEKHDVDQLILQLRKQRSNQHHQKQNQQENTS